MLSYNDFSLTHPGFYVFMAHQVSKEVMATLGSAANLSGAASVSLDVGF